MGGTCSVPEGIVRDVSSVCNAQRQCGASHTSVGYACERAAGPAPQRSCLVGSRQRERETWAQHQDRPSVQAVQRGSTACESPDEIEKRQSCESVNEEVNRKLGQCENSPNYKSFPRGTCVWEDDVRVRSSKLERANCESQREREQRGKSESSQTAPMCSAATFSERVVGERESESKQDQGKHTGVRFGKISVPSNLKEAQQSPQWEYWKAAMQKEQNSLDAHEVMEYVPRPRGHKVIPVH